MVFACTLTTNVQIYVHGKLYVINKHRGQCNSVPRKMSVVKEEPSVFVHYKFVRVVQVTC